jgi:hypothetical protein
MSVFDSGHEATNYVICCILLLHYFKTDILIANDHINSFKNNKNTPHYTYSEMYGFNKNVFFAAAMLENFIKNNTVRFHSFTNDKKKYLVLEINSLNDSDIFSVAHVDSLLVGHHRYSLYIGSI